MYKTFEIGTAVKITTVLSVSNPTSASITIKNPSNITEVDAAVMTADTPNVYSYIYQSSTSKDDGTYQVIIDVVHGAYTARKVDYFTLIDTVL